MTTRTTTRVERQSGQGVWAHMAMTALTVAALGALVLWLGRQGGEKTTTPVVGSETRGSVTARESTRVTTRGSLAERTAAPTIYIVESQGSARAILDLGLSPLDQQMVWFDSAEAEVQFWATQEASRIRDSVGLAAISVVDLRSQSAASCPGQEAASADASLFRVAAGSEQAERGTLLPVARLRGCNALPPA